MTALQAFSFPSSHCQSSLLVDPKQPLMIHRFAAPFQQHAQPAVAKPRLLSRQFRKPRTQFRVAILSRLVPVAAAVHVVELASAALAQAKLLLRERHVLPGAYELQPFFAMIAFIASLSRLKSATMSFNRRFSSSSCRNRLASFTCMLAYLFFHAYNVAALTPNSRATSAVFRPPSICFTAAMIFSSLCRLFLIFVLLSKLENSNYDWSSFRGAGHVSSAFQELQSSALANGAKTTIAAKGRSSVRMQISSTPFTNQDAGRPEPVTTDA